jgi:large conductance mechanosensitive channel
VGAFVSAVVYFLVFMAVVYFAVVVPYTHVQARRGVSVFGEPAPTKTCFYRLSGTVPLAATKCRYCARDLAPQAAATDAPTVGSGPAAFS